MALQPLWLTATYLRYSWLPLINLWLSYTLSNTYASSHKRFVNVALIFAFGVNFLSTAAVKVESFTGNRAFTWTAIAYNIVFGLMFLAVVGLFVAIVVKLILNERKMRQVGPVTHR